MTALVRFLGKRFDSLFADYDASWLELCAAAYRRSEAIFRTDIARKAPRLAGEPGFAEEVIGWLWTRAPLQAVLLDRISNEIHKTEGEHPVLDHLAFIMRATTAMEIYYTATIGEAFTVNHGAGTVIGPRHVIGRNFTVYQGVTVGQREIRSPEQHATIGDRVFLFSGAKVLGALRIGDDVRVAANAVLLTDAESGRTYAGIPARPIASS